jgi:prepilin-type N-terminal cleavage/methylation domain-containing protein
MTHATRLPFPPAARRARPRGPARAGFTLIELLVVIVIIGVLIGLGAGGAQRIRVTMKVKASQDTVAKCQSAIDDQIKAINGMVAKEQRERSSEYTTLLSYCDGDPDRAAALLTYCRVRQYFPVTQADLATPSFAVGGVAFYRPLGMQQLNGLSGNPAFVSAAILHSVVSKRTLGGITFAADVGLNGAQIEVGPPDLSATRMVFKDSWGNPIGYSLITEAQVAELGTDARFTNPNHPVGRRDPFDPQGKLYGWANTANKNAAQAALGVVFDGRNKWLIAYSAGVDQAYAPGFGGDDILGHRTRSVGAKGTQ